MNRESEELEEVVIIDEERPNRGRVILFAILGYSVVACAAYFFFFQLSAENLFGDVFAGAEEGSTEIVSAFPPAAYFVPENDTLLSAQQIATANLQVAHDEAMLGTILGNNPEIYIIYIHPAMIDQFDAAVFRRQYEAQKLLVAINTPLSELATAVGLTPNVPDLPLEEFVSGTAVAAVQARESGPPLEFVATYPQFDQVPAVVTGLRSYGMDFFK